MHSAAEKRLGIVLDGWKTLQRAHMELERGLRRDLRFTRMVTPDGHTVGRSISDCVAAIAFDLILEQGMSNPSCDATTRERRQSVEVKATQRRSWAFRDPAAHGDPAYVVLLVIDEGGGWWACWHGDAAPVYEALRARGKQLDRPAHDLTVPASQN